MESLYKLWYIKVERGFGLKSDMYGILIFMMLAINVLFVEYVECIKLTLNFSFC